LKKYIIPDYLINFQLSGVCAGFCGWWTDGFCARASNIP